MEEKLKIIASIFGTTEDEEAEELPLARAPINHGKFYGGVYNGRKHMYSEILIKTLSPERLEAFIKKQIGYEPKK